MTIEQRKNIILKRIATLAPAQLAAIESIIEDFDRSQEALTQEAMVSRVVKSEGSIQQRKGFTLSEVRDQVGKWGNPKS